MLFGVEAARDCAVRARDGELGSVEDLFFDDRDWSLAYAVMKTGKWFRGRRVLLPREAVKGFDWDGKALVTSLPREEIESASGVEAHPPLAKSSRDHFYRGLVWTSYPWGGFSSETSQAAERQLVGDTDPSPPETHVRSAREIVGYHIEATDGRMGHVEDFLFDDETLVVCYLVIDTRDWLPGKKVVLSPSEVTRMRWRDEVVDVDLDREAVRGAPELDASEVSRSSGPRVRLVV